MSQFTIGEVASRTGLAASAIRYYESVGIVPKPARKNGRRIYDEDWMRRLGICLLAQEAGFSLKEIQQLTQRLARPNAPPSKTWQNAAKSKLSALQEQKERITQMEQLLNNLLRCDCTSLAACEEFGLDYVLNRRAGSAAD